MDNDPELISQRLASWGEKFDVPLDFIKPEVISKDLKKRGASFIRLIIVFPKLRRPKSISKPRVRTCSSCRLETHLRRKILSICFCNTFLGYRGRRRIPIVRLLLSQSAFGGLLKTSRFNHSARLCLILPHRLP
jgi:hypothetical protein